MYDILHTFLLFLFSIRPWRLFRSSRMHRNLPLWIPNHSVYRHSLAPTRLQVSAPFSAQSKNMKGHFTIDLLVVRQDSFVYEVESFAILTFLLGSFGSKFQCFSSFSPKIEPTLEAHLVPATWQISNKDGIDRKTIKKKPRFSMNTSSTFLNLTKKNTSKHPPPPSDNARAVADGMDKASNRVQKVAGNRVGFWVLRCHQP